VQVLRDIDASDLDLDQIEEVEKISLRLAFQALIWFAPQAWDIFDRSPDDPQDIAEDVTREAIGVFKGFSINERLFGTIDYKQARWLPMPFGLVPQALMVDSKAKKANEDNRLDLQMSQVSMVVELGNKDESHGPC
jgi:Type II restriction enzyme SfiI